MARALAAPPPEASRSRDVQRGADRDEDDPGHGQCRRPQPRVPAESPAYHQARERQHAFRQEEGKPGECGKRNRHTQREKGTGEAGEHA